MQTRDLTAFLADHPPFDALAPEVLREVVRTARVEEFTDGALVLDAYADRPDELFVVVSGQDRKSVV